MQEPHTPEQLRHAIDSGRAHDKIAGSDPAAAPLHADEEASGTPTSPESIAQDWREQQEAAATIPYKSAVRAQVWGIGGLVLMVAVVLTTLTVTLA